MTDEHGMPMPGDVLTKADFEFCSHAFNWIIPCRDIVRRLATYKTEHELFVLICDAEKLWGEMQAKGGGDES